MILKLMLDKSHDVAEANGGCQKSLEMPLSSDQAWKKGLRKENSLPETMGPPTQFSRGFVIPC